MALPVGSYSGGAGGAGGSAGPSSALGKDVFDNSGWNVNFGSGTIDSNACTVCKYLPYVLGAAALWIAWRVTRK